MKIFLIGGTGLTGSYLLPKLLEHKHEVFTLTRSENKLEKVKSLGGVPVLGDITEPSEFKNELPENLDLIILLAMPNVVPGRRVTKKRKRELKEEVNAFFRNSMNIATEYDIPVILPGGTSYQTMGDEIADETWPIRRVGITEIGADTDHMVNEAIKTGTPKIIQLIYGKIYGNGGLFQFQYNMMAKGKGKIIGKGDNYVPNIYAGDAANAIIKAIEKLPVGEKILIIDDVPVKMKDFTIYMAEIMNKKRPGYLPGFLIKLVIGRDLFEVVRMNCIASNEKAKKILDWHPEFPSYKEGLLKVIEEMREGPNYFDRD